MLELLEPQTLDDPNHAESEQGSAENLEAPLLVGFTEQRDETGGLAVVVAGGELATGQLLIAAGQKGKRPRHKEPKRPHIVVTHRTPAENTGEGTPPGGGGNGEGGVEEPDDDPGDGIPYYKRTQNDYITRPGERFRRGELDRPIKAVDFLFSTIGKSPDAPKEVIEYHPENTPSYVSAEILKRDGHVDIADIGCGTGRTLYSWGRKIAGDTGRSISDVRMIGLSRRNYSKESQLREVVQACNGSDPLVRYLIGDAAILGGIGPKSQDVTLAFNSVVHAEDPGVWVANMIRITRPGGTILFNADYSQAFHGILPAFLGTLLENKWQIQVAYVELPRTPQAVKRKRNETALYRIDVPEAA